MDDDTTSLVSELLQKLAELQRKVDNYSQDMAQQFKRYKDELLKGVPRDVSSKVEKAITDSLHQYPALRSGIENQRHPAADSHLPPTTSTTHTHGTSTPVHNLNGMARSGGVVSPPPVSLNTTGIPLDNGPRSPHEREREFHGLFIPSYLPLLEAAERDSPAPTSSPLPTVPKNSDKGEPNRVEAASSQSLAPIVVSRPDPVRRYTEETLSSITSDDSNSRVKKSALRRSSSSSIKPFSPRRVRFDVEGQEVLPTASPQSRPADLPGTQLGNDTNTSNEPSRSDIVGGGGDLDLLGSSPPRPKKITSTEKLKALARNSTEDTSKWTVVGNQGSEDDEEDELVMADFNGRRRGGASQAPAATHNRTSISHDINNTHPPNLLGPPLQMVKGKEGGDDAEDESDDDILSMPALSSFKGRKRFSPPESTITTPKEMAPQHHKSKDGAATSRKTTTEASHVYDVGDFDEEAMFDFEDVPPGDSASSRTATKPDTKYIEEDEPEDLPVKPPAKPVKETSHPRSPGVPIAKRSTPTVTSPQGRVRAGSVGSLRGKPLHMNSVRDEKILEQAAAMGDIQTFIGSVDGRTGIDETTSYQPEATKFVGTPRSFSERLMKEELESRKQNTTSRK
ncbi:hypothetical protein DL766_004506 [Monosporascus sp. MC13-8B]|uniref:Shugoshin C-terminal domain-containing protein n=1 Tax=Monosporascus cannonballus TaxID=155416 RepID=A0ABY0H5F7_9PEZI|nr:hypothetical protein DL762_005646 [Monosporascus cannonballus]RYP31198.1 hypothetical protein DL766_004506 [Monosporascus sp. MC13-8B]